MGGPAGSPRVCSVFYAHVGVRPGTPRAVEGLLPGSRAAVGGVSPRPARGGLCRGARGVHRERDRVAGGCAAAGVCGAPTEGGEAGEGGEGGGEGTHPGRRCPGSYGDYPGGEEATGGGVWGGGDGVAGGDVPRASGGVAAVGGGCEVAVSLGSGVVSAAVWGAGAE